MKMRITSSFLCQCLLLLTVGILASCNNLKDDTVEAPHLTIDKSNLMRYVNCPEDTVNQMLAVGDSVFARLDSFKIEHLDLLNDEYNAVLDSLYGDTISLTVSVFASYAEITNRECNVINSVFVWHEVAKAQIASFMGKTTPSDEDIKNILNIIDEILLYYAGGVQWEMNNVAWRRVMLSDFELVGSYKHLIDICQDDDIVALIHKSYQTVLDSYKSIYDSCAGGYSDFPREMGVLMAWLMDAKRGEIDTLTGQYVGGEITMDEVKKILSDPKLNTDIERDE